MSVLLTVNIVSHNPAQSSSDNYSPLTSRQSPSLGCCLSDGRGGWHLWGRDATPWDQ